MLSRGAGVAGGGAIMLAAPGAAGRWRRRGRRGALAAGVGLVCAGLLTGGPGVAAAGSSAGRAAGTAVGIGWGTVRRVPGLAALEAGGSAGLDTVSCWRAGACTAGGSYLDAGKHSQAFVVTENDGHWGKAEQVPGTAALNLGGDAMVSLISCASDGDCAAGGSYADHNGHRQVFVAEARDGRWGRAEEMPGTGRLNVGGDAAVLALSCTRGGNCSAGGYYQGYNPPGTGDNFFVAYLATATSGRWGKAIEVPGLAAVLPAQFPEAMTVAMSCSAAGDCSAGGFYYTYSAAGAFSHAFVVTRASGRWGRIRRPKGASVNGMSCIRPGNCVAAGSGFVLTQHHGTWGTPVPAPADVNSVSCRSPGSCTAGGDLGFDGGGYPNGAFVMSERSGRWRKPLDLPGPGQRGIISAVSCGSAGNCGAAGSYFTGSYDDDGDPLYGGFVAGERNGRWAAPQLPPGLPALNPGGVSTVSSVSCPVAWTCAAVGSYTDSSGNSQAFLLGSL